MATLAIHFIVYVPPYNVRIVQVLQAYCPDGSAFWYNMSLYRTKASTAPENLTMRKLLDEDDFEKFLKIIKEGNSLQAESTDADKSKFFISSSHGGLSF